MDYDQSQPQQGNLPLSQNVSTQSNDDPLHVSLQSQQRITRAVFMVLGMLLIIEIIGGGIWYFRKMNRKQNVITESLALSTNQNVPTVVPTEGKKIWKEYVNKTDKYTFLLPPGYTVVEATSKEQSQPGVTQCITSITTHMCVFTLRGLDNSKNLSIQDFLTSLNLFPKGDSSPNQLQKLITTLDGHPGIKIMAPTNGNQRSVYIANGTKVYALFQMSSAQTPNEDRAYLADFEEIISTFHFSK
jgi:hypothetical protein